MHKISEISVVRTVAGLLLLGIVTIVLPSQGGYVLSIATFVAIFAIAAVSMAPLVRCGLISLATPGFMALGGYSVAMTSLYLDWSPWLALVPAIVLPALTGAALAFPVSRLKGFYLAMATLAFTL